MNVMIKCIRILSVLITGISFTCVPEGKLNSVDPPGERPVDRITISRQEPDSIGQFLSISFLDQDHGWAVTSDSLWKSDNGGTSWTKEFTFQNEEKQGLELSPELRRIETPSQDKILVLTGWNGLVRFDRKTGEIKTVFGVERGIIRNFDFYDDTHGWVVGQTHTKPGGNWDPMIFRTTDGGISWKQVAVVGLKDCNCSLYGVLSLDKTAAIVTGDYLLAKVDAGNRFRLINDADDLQRSLPGRPGVPHRLNGRHLVSILGSQNNFIVSYDGGENWISRILPAGSLILDLKFVRASTVLLLTENAIEISRDSGNTWELLKPVVAGVKDFLYRMPGTDRCYLVSDKLEEVFPDGK